MKKATVILCLAVLILLTVFTGAVINAFHGSGDLYEESHQTDMYSAVFEMNDRTVSYSTGDHKVKFKDIDGRLKEFDRAFRRLKLKKLDADPLADQRSHAELSLYFDNAQFDFKIGLTPQEQLKAIVSFDVLKPEHSGIYEADTEQCAELIELAGSLFNYGEYPAEYDTSAIESIISEEWKWLDGSTRKNGRNYIIEDEYAEKILTALKSGGYTPVDRNSLKFSDDYHYVTLYNERASAELRFYTAYYPDHRMINLLEFEKDGFVYSYETDFSIYTSVLFGDGHNLIVDEMFHDWKEFSYCEYEITADSDTFSVPVTDFDIQNTPASWLQYSFIQCFGTEHELNGTENSTPAFVMKFGAKTENGIVYDKITLTCSTDGINSRYWLKAELENSPDFLEWEESYCYELTKSDYDELVSRVKNAKEVYGNDSGIS
ncbi:MAG: hypothetical protein IJ007_09445 [Oscillospiraceae bacterium]|nr:hypothetical protein [Oscillospiraceae bacterium]